MSCSALVKSYSTLWESVEVHVIGSCATELFLPESDIDLVVRNPKNKPTLTIQDLHTLGTQLQSVSSSIQIISTASVPLIKLVDNLTTFTVDITLNIDTGLYSTSLVLAYLHTYPVLRPLTIVLKQFLKMRGLNDLYTGGLPSYTLILMIVSFLQFYKPNDSDSDSDSDDSNGSSTHHSYPNGVTTNNTALNHHNVSAHSNNGHHRPSHRSATHSPDLGHYLLSFFELYGRTFPYNAVGIRVRDEGGYFPKHSRKWLHLHNPELLCLENPLDTSIDLGFKVFRIADIRQAFSQAYELLSSSGGGSFTSVSEHFLNLTATAVAQQNSDANSATVNGTDTPSPQQPMSAGHTSSPQTSARSPLTAITLPPPASTPSALPSAAAPRPQLLQHSPLLQPAGPQPLLSTPPSPSPSLSSLSSALSLPPTPTTSSLSMSSSPPLSNSSPLIDSLCLAPTPPPQHSSGPQQDFPYYNGTSPSPSPYSQSPPPQHYPVYNNYPPHHQFTGPIMYPHYQLQPNSMPPPPQSQPPPQYPYMYAHANGGYNHNSNNGPRRNSHSGVSNNGRYNGAASSHNVYNHNHHVNHPQSTSYAPHPNNAPPQPPRKTSKHPKQHVHKPQSHPQQLDAFHHAPQHNQTTAPTNQINANNSTAPLDNASPIVSHAAGVDADANKTTPASSSTPSLVS